MLPGGKKEKYPLDIPDLKTALLYAEQDIKDRGDLRDIHKYVNNSTCEGWELAADER